LPVKAPAAAPAAAPMDAARALPVAAPPMIAPVAAPHAAPWPTGVSHDVSMQQLTAMTELTVKNCRSHNLLSVCDIAQRSPADLAAPPQFSLLSVEPVLGINKDLLRMRVDHQPPVVNFQAVILFMRRIWAGNNAGRIMRVASAEWISS
jgi:hypothetical protein